ncbi:hypothetical protein K443DRAFT_673256 [Laccaria amethystina LaAM-08-1]|uniref:Uncharacterized protein n=1 Tax=Laccaria amethystina LaAM-08-1 TaxID=1095629 RepID=A0A0C9X659_9AGAR|nr:hypothetical protein K443DRAFT_673256 [Laccaria amethystina LaAM-08-1]
MCTTFDRNQQLEMDCSRPWGLLPYIFMRGFKMVCDQEKSMQDEDLNGSQTGIPFKLTERKIQHIWRVV